MTMHDDQLVIGARTVRELVRRQFPAWPERPVTPVGSSGTVHAIFRLGGRLAARFPLRPGDPDAVRRDLEAEAQAAAELAGQTRFATPEPVAIGDPGAGYPLPWSVQTWLPGVTAADGDPGSSAGLAADLAEFIAGVRAIGTRGRTFSGSGRGGDLARHDPWVQECLQRSEGLLDVPGLRRIWAGLRDLPRGPGGDVMSHKDLIPGNVLVSNGRLAGVLDVGDLGPADPALDLVGGWHLLDAGPRQVLRATLRCTDLEWQRGMGWAFEQAIGAAWYYQHTNPAMSLMGTRTLRRIQDAVRVRSTDHDD
ncbi:MAG: aminoglycoside phosphotransferase family protein [Streptosporangiaceae bacterium]